MSQENSQLDITDRQMLAVSPQPASVWTEIGEARITHNIFGKAKVRIVRRNDGMRRALWWMALIVIVVIAWSGWKAFGPDEQRQSEDSLPHVIPDVQENASSPTESIAPPTTAPAGSMTMQNETAKPPVIEKKSAQPEQAMKAVAPIHKPLAPRPSIVTKPQALPMAASGAAAVQATKPLPPKQAAPKPLPPKTTATPAAAASAAMKPAASSPEPVMQLSSPVMEEESKPQQPQNQPAK